MRYYADEFMTLKERLKHHGIPGQKWGDKNGPPYPLQPSDHSAAEKKAAISSSGVKHDKKESPKVKNLIKWKTKKGENGTYDVGKIRCGSQKIEVKVQNDAQKKLIEDYASNFEEHDKIAKDLIYKDAKRWMDEPVSKEQLNKNLQIWGISFYDDNTMDIGYEHKDFWADSAVFGDHSIDIEYYPKKKKGMISING